MSDDWMDDPELEARLISTFRRHAGALVIADHPFDAGTLPTAGSRPPTANVGLGVEVGSVPDGSFAGGADTDADGSDADDPIDLPPLPISTIGQRRRRPRAVVWLAGAAAAAILIAALVMVSAVRDPDLRTGNGEDAPVLVGPDAVWIPSWVPDDLQLWDVLAVPGAPTEWGPSDRPRPMTQLLVEGDGGPAAILLTAEVETFAPEGAPITVRGSTGSVRDPVPATGGTIPTFMDADKTIIAWPEAGVVVSATLRSLSVDQALVVLEGLEPRNPSDLLAGFEPPAGGSWSVTGEQLAGPTVTATPTSAYFVYADHAPTAGDVPPLTVQTTSATGDRRHYLQIAFSGTVSEAGVASMTTKDRLGTTVTEQVWPDGRALGVSGAAATDPEAVRRITDGVVAADLERVRALKAEASDRLATGTVVASADLPSGKVEVLGDGEPTALCLTPSTGGARSCSARYPMATIDETLVGSATIGGSWYVFVAARGTVELEAEWTSQPGEGAMTDPASSSPVARQPVGETVEVGGWTLALAAVPEGADRLSMYAATRGWSLDRMLI
jgi:hypothetical protein